MMFTRAYLRASTAEQDADRAKADLDRFAADHGLSIAAYYREHESGARLDRPELQRLISDSTNGDVLLLEQVDRLSRLNQDDWAKLRARLREKEIRVVALDLPTSWLMATSAPDAFTSRMFAALNDLMLDVLAAVARKDYEDRRRRQAQGIAKAKAEGRFKGRPENMARNRNIARLLEKEMSWNQIAATIGCARGTVARVARQINALGKGGAT